MQCDVPVIKVAESNFCHSAEMVEPLLKTQEVQLISQTDSEQSKPRYPLQSYFCSLLIFGYWPWNVH